MIETLLDSLFQYPRKNHISLAALEQSEHLPIADAAADAGRGYGSSLHIVPDALGLNVLLEAVDMHDASSNAAISPLRMQYLG